MDVENLLKSWQFVYICILCESIIEFHDSVTMENDFRFLFLWAFLQLWTVPLFVKPNHLCSYFIFSSIWRAVMRLGLNAILTNCKKVIWRNESMIAPINFLKDLLSFLWESYANSHGVKLQLSIFKTVQILQFEFRILKLNHYSFVPSGVRSRIVLGCKILFRKWWNNLTPNSKFTSSIRSPLICRLLENVIFHHKAPVLIMRHKWFEIFLDFFLRHLLCSSLFQIIKNETVLYFFFFYKTLFLELQLSQGAL